MSEHEASKGNRLLTFLGALGAILIFALIILVAYLPNRPDPVNQAIAETRKLKATETIAQGKAKLTSYEVVDAASGVVRIPIEIAMEQTINSYQSFDRAMMPAVPATNPSAE
ncbi:MAG: hypothetical protein ACI81V_000723 [Lentimonas sp.]|jgi:hypothetical protein